MINNFMIIKINFIKINIIKVFAIKTYIIAEESNSIRGYITKNYNIVRKYNIIKFFNHLTCDKAIRNKF